MHKKKFASVAAIFAAAIAIFATANFARGADNDLIITEIMYNPAGSDDKNEWVEIYNPTSSTIPIDKDTFRISDSSGVCHKINSDLNLAPGKFAIIADDRDTFLDTYASYADKASVADSSFDLKDSDVVKLSFDKCSNWQAEFFYTSDWGGKDNGKSLEKIDLAGDNTKNNWRESCEDCGTPGEEPETCETASDSLSEDDETADPDVEAPAENSINNDDETGIPKKTYSKNLKITELLPNPSADEDAGEFTEIFNSGSTETVNLSGWRLEDKTGNAYSLPDISLEPGEYRAFYRNKSAFSLNNSGSETVFLKDPDGKISDQVSYSGTVKADFSWALAGGSFSWIATPTPGEENIIDAVEASIEASTGASDSETDMNAAENYSSADGIYLNEIFPNPKKNSDGEYIEIANNGNDSVDLIGWTIRDGSKNGKYVFKESAIIETSGYLAIYRPQSKLALNNTAESLTLFNPQGEIVSSVSWKTSQKNTSYNFDEENWRWSKYLTPGKDNEFDSKPSVKIKKPKYAYKNLFTEFSAKVKDKETKKLKYSWDFGDGKRSSLEDPTHKYLDTGKYTVTLSVTDDSQTIEKNFTLTVKKYPLPKIEIVKIVPNPAGADTEGEIVEVRNNSSKKIDLPDWKIATGSGENTYNHPIIGEINLGPNETKTITREFSKFSLNNKAGKVSLVSPDGKIADTVEYAKEKIAENEAYAKIDGQWKWLDPDAQGEGDITKEPADEDVVADGEVLGATDESAFVSPSRNSRFTSEDAYIFLSRINFLRTVERKMTYRPSSNPSSNIAYLIASLI